MTIPLTLRWRIQMQWLALFAVLLVVLLMVAYQRERRQWIERIDERLTHGAWQFSTQGTLGPGVSFAGEWDGAGTLRHHGGNLASLGWDADAPTQTDWRWRDGNRERVEARTDGSLMVVGCSATVIDESLAAIAATYGGTGIGLVLLVAGAGTWLSARQLRPLCRLALDAGAVADGRLDQRLPEAGCDREIDELVKVFNLAFCRLDEAVRHEVSFMCNVSHELRTPVAIMLNECDWVFEKQRSGADYQASLELCRRTAGNLRERVESLLQVARFNANAYELEKTVWCLGSLVQEACGLVGELARERGVRIHAQLQEVLVRADARRVRQTVLTLIRHALLHSERGSHIEVSVRRSGDRVIVDTTDQGTGLTPYDLERVFDTGFQRGDVVPGDVERTGIGLAVSRAIARAGGGDLRVSSDGRRGCTLSLELPRHELREHMDHSRLAAMFAGGDAWPA